MARIQKALKDAGLYKSEPARRAANPVFREDVRRRKLCIAEGKETVHGITYDLAGQFGLDLRKAD